MTAPWWQSAVFYQIYPRSFATGRPAPTGDLAGIEAHLDHLSWLGVDALWISPFYPSPQADFGYDVSDHCDVDPVYGDLAAFDRLLASCHARDIKPAGRPGPQPHLRPAPVVPGGTVEPDDPKRDWYVWRDGSPDTPPNNWRAAFIHQPAWTWDDATGQWYLHLFLPAQPDLNWANPEVVEAMHGVMRFWLDRGVDGFRIDVVHGLGKADGLPDDPPDTTLPHATLNDTAENHEIIRGLRSVVDEYPGDRLILGEVYLMDTRKVATYYGHRDELHLAFNFPPLYTPWDARRWRRPARRRRALDRVPGWLAHLGPVQPRQPPPPHPVRLRGPRPGRAVPPARAPGLAGALRGRGAGPGGRLRPAGAGRRPRGRDGCRAPIPWTGEPDHGWGVTDPWLPWPPEADQRNVAAQVADPGSIAHLYRRLLAARTASPALQLGDQAPVEAPPPVVAWRRHSLRAAGAGGWWRSTWAPTR